MMKINVGNGSKMKPSTKRMTTTSKRKTGGCKSCGRGR